MTTATDVATEEQAPAPTSEPRRSSYDTRERFSTLLGRHPSELATILTLDPTLLSDEHFLARYPELAAFVADHPEVRHNPRFYLGEFRIQDRDTLDTILEPIMIVFGFSLLAFALSWAIRQAIEQRRWSRLSRTQSEVHNKILDRFGTTAELLEYIRTPAGTKFLESAPIPLYVDRPAPQAPYNRTIWSIQLGVIVAAVALGMLLVSFRFGGESGAALFALGLIALCLGGGFIASAFVSIRLSRRLGLLDEGRGDEAGPVR
jgi:hypothetical protein